MTIDTRQIMIPNVYKQCDRCGKPIHEGRAEYSIRIYGQYLCGSQKNPSYCVQFRLDELAEPH